MRQHLTIGQQCFTRKRSAVRICQVPLPFSILINKELHFNRNVPPTPLVLAIYTPKVGKNGAFGGILLSMLAALFVIFFHLCKNRYLQNACKIMTNQRPLI